MSKIETTSKVSLKLTSRINLGRRGAHVPSSRLWTQPTSTHTARKALIPNPQEKAAPHGPDGSTHKSAPNPPPKNTPGITPPNRIRPPTTPPPMPGAHAGPATETRMQGRWHHTRLYPKH